MIKKKIDDSLTFREYKKLACATLSLLSHYPNSSAYFDYSRADLASKAYQWYKQGEIVPKLLTKGYLGCAILPVNISDLSKKQFDALHTLYGDSLVKLRFIDDNFLRHIKNSADLESVLNTGGACAIESTDTKILNTFKNKKRTDLVVPYIEHFAEITPTWSQITGAFVPVRGLNIMYDETYPWYLRFAQYGIDNAEVFVKKIYDGIYTAVVRYSRLQNPENIVIRIPFTDLDLENDGSLRELYELYKSNIRALGLDKNTKSVYSYNAQLNKKMWVEYTYRGVNILEKLKKIVREKYSQESSQYHTQKATMHIRSKQIDHLTMERQDAWLNDIVLNGKQAINKKNQRKIAHLLQMYNKVHVLGLSMWFKDNYRTLPVGFAGMLDFAYEGNIVHEYPRRTMLEDVLEGKRLVQSLTDSIFRPNASNIDKVILHLKKYTCAPNLTIPKDTLSTIDELVNREKKLLRKVGNLNLLLVDFELYNRLWMRYQEHSYEKNKQLKQITINTFFFKNMKNTELFQYLIQRYKQDYSLFPLVKNKDDIWRKNAELSLLSFLSRISIIKTHQSKVEFSMKFTPEDIIFGKKLYELISKEFVVDKSYLDKLEGELAHVRDHINSIVKKVEIDVLQLEQLSSQEAVNILPLADNYFVSFVQQFLFVPRVRTAYVALSAIEQEKGSAKEKGERITHICQEVFPIIEKMLLYVFKGGTYPYKERYSV